MVTKDVPIAIDNFHNLSTVDLSNAYDQIKSPHQGKLVQPVLEGGQNGPLEQVQARTHQTSGGQHTEVQALRFRTLQYRGK
jgi:flagellar hook-length control protein FliK